MRPCLIDGILPSNAIHLLGGSPGAGKTRLTFGLIDQWQKGEPVLGHLSTPAPYTFVSLDRPRDSVEETLETMGLKDSVTRLVCLNELPDDAKYDKLSSVLDFCAEKYPDTRMLFMEGYQLFAGDGLNKYNTVARLLKDAAKRCVRDNLTILGVCHSPKMKKGAEFVKGRDRIGGTVAWSAYSETVMIVDADEKTKVRTVDIYPRNAPEEQHEMIMTTGGVLVKCPKERGEQLYIHILTITEGQTFTRQWLVQLAEDLEVGAKTADRAIKRALDEQQIQPDSDGIYKRTYSS